MKKKLLKKLLFLTLFLFLAFKGNAQYASSHYIAPSPWQYWSNANELVLTTESSTTVTVAIKKSDGTLLTTRTLTSAAPDVYRFDGSPWQLNSNPVNTIQDDRGLIVECTGGKVSVNLRNVASDQANGSGGDTTGATIKGNASLVSFGNEGRGTSFRLGYYRSNFAGIAGFNGAANRPVYSVMAIDDNTQVKLNGANLVLLNKGQSYLFQPVGTGELLEANKPVVANTGAYTDAPGGCGDGAVDQMAPVSILGTRYIVIRGSGTAGTGTNLPEQSTIIATESSTDVTVTNYNQNGVFINTITYSLTAAGSYQSIHQGDANNRYSSSIIESTKPIAVYSGSAQTCEVDIATVLPVGGCSGSKRTSTSEFKGYEGQVLPYFGFVLVESQTATVFVNGNNIETTTGKPRFPIGTTGYYLLRFENTEIGNPTDITVTSTARMNVGVVQQGGGFSMSGFFSSFNETPALPEVTKDSNGCAMNIITADSGLEPYQWYLDGVLLPGATSQSIVPAKTGNYSITGTRDCGVTGKSAAIYVAVCGDREVKKTVADGTLANQVVFSVTVKNNGPNVDKNVVVNDLLPSGYTFVSAVPSVGTYTAGTGVWNVGDLALNGTADLAITATIKATGTVTNTATVTGDNIDFTLNNDIATATPLAELKLLKTARAGVFNKAGDIIVYDLVLTNTGKVPVLNISITDANADSGSVSPATISTLLPGASVNVTASHTVLEADLILGKVINSAHTTGVDGSNNPISDESGTNINNDIPTETETKSVIIANNNSITTNEDTAVTIDVTANDTNVGGTTVLATVDLDPATPGIQTAFTVTGQGTYTVDALGIVTFTPAANYNGTATPINYTVNDNHGIVSNTATISITVTAVNDNPVAVNDTQTTNEDTAVTIDVTANDTDLDGTIDVATVDLDPATLGIQTAFTVTGQGTYTVDALGIVTFTPVANYNGTATPINYTVNDNSGIVSNTATISITVTAVNDNPVANDATDATIPSTAGATSVSTLTATDTDGTIANYIVLTLPSHGTLALAGVPVTANQVLTPLQASTFTYDPSGTYTGDDTFTFTATDNNGLVDATPATITIPVGNNAPTANDAANAGIPSTAGATSVSTLTATDTDGTIANYIVLTLPSHGTLALAGVPVTANQVLTPLQASTLTYDPSGTYTGDDTFTFTATDNNGLVDATPATITIPVGNNAPTANDAANAGIPSTAGATSVSTLTATDTDGTIANFTVLTLPSHGTLALAGVPVTANQVLTPLQASTLTYDPSGTYTGDDTFTFTATDNNGLIDATPATITIPVGNNAPTANDAANAGIPSTAGVTAVSTLTATDTDGTVVNYTVLTLPSHGTLALAGVPVTANQVLTPLQASTLTYDPSGTYTGDDIFTFTATDNNGLVDATPATITIPVGNNAPTANDAANAGIPSTAGATAVSTLTATDTDGTIANYTVLTLPSHGTLALAGVPVTVNQVLTPLQASTLTYDPSGTYTGDDIFTFTATDNNGLVDATPATITIPVGNNAPTANDAANASIPSTAGATAVSTLTATDTDGTIANYIVLTLPSHGTLALAGVPVTANQVLTPLQASTLTYDPSGTYTGDDTFTFTATDNNGLVDATPATITIPVGNNAPTANDAANAGIPSTAGATSVSTLTATDTDGTIANFTVLTVPSHGTLALAGVPVTANQVLTPLQASTLTYDPSGTYTGDDIFTFTATDNNGLVDATPATITIPVGNNAPTANDAANASIPSTAGATSVSTLTATDTDGTVANYIVLTLPSHGTLALAGVPVTANQVLTPLQASTLTYDPSGTYTGDDIFTFTATDNNGLVDATPATITIPVGNNAPTANDAANAGIPSTAGATAVSTLTATDTDGTIANYTVLTLPSHGTLALAGVPVTVNQVLTPLQASTLTYDPSGTYTGDDIFTFTATDNNGLVDATPATITIPVGNNAPTANDAANASIPSTAGATSVSTLTATDTDGTVANYIVLTLPSHGTLALAGVPVTANQVLTPLQASTLTYDPSGTYTGDDTFTFTATDNNGLIDATPATITIPVGNNAPTANDAANAGIPSTAGVTAVSTLTATDTDGTVVNYTVLTLPSHGTLALAGVPVTANQVLTPLQASTLTYDPSGTYTGDDIFTFTATDNNGLVDATPATITIPVGNNAPTANDAANAGIPSTAGATAVSTLTATDTDGTIANYTVLTLPSHGTLALAGVPVTVNQVLTPLQASTLTYDPSGTYTGDDIFTFTATDNNGLVDATPATITIPVGNNAPTANDAANASIPSTAGATAVSTLTATDTDGTIANYTVLTVPSHGILALAGVPVTVNQILTPLEASMLTYDPSGTFTGDDTFTFTATDDLGAIALSAGTITIPVANNAPVANDDDTNASIPSRAGATSINALTATDTDGTVVSYTILSLPSHGTLALSGTAITVNQVLTPLEVSMLTYDPSGAFSGNETFTFTATDNNGSIDTTPATITIVVEKTIINAVNDPVNSVVGIDKTVTVVNIFDNDTLNNNPLIPSDVDLHIPVDPTGTMTLKPDGTVELIPNAPAGNYSLTYEICERANLSNCNTATVSVTVVAPTMTITANSYCNNNAPYVSYNVVADNFTPTGLLTIKWIDSANNVVATQTNMPLSGNVLWPGAVVDGNNKPTDWPGWVLVSGQWIQGNDGFELTKPAVTMQFTLNPTQSVVVNYPGAVSGCNAMPTFGIQAGNEDDITLADGLNGSLEAINVLNNDTLNGVPAKASDVILKGQNWPTGITLNDDGTIDVAPGTEGGEHTLTYQVCEKANSSNCTTATVKIFVEIPAIAVVKTVVLNDDNNNGYAEAGETLTYNFTITNKGNTDLENITVSDPLPGIVMNGGPINLAAGQSDNSSITGTYTLTQADIDAGSISNQATASGTTKSGIMVSDKSDSNDAEGDKPTILELSGCVIKIFNAVSANGDNQNERFYIQGIECYPDNTVQIFNRWGVLVFEREHYNNNDIAFRGISEGRVTVKDSNGLPEGTYYYIVRYKDKQSNLQQEAGYLYLTK